MIVPGNLGTAIRVASRQRTQAFASSPSLKATMQAAGIISAPEVTWMTPVSENLVWDRTLPAMMIVHTVGDFAVWQSGYAQADAIRKAGGIIGHAVNRSRENPNQVIVYHQAETHDAIAAFAANPNLKAAMQATGVTGVPTFTFVTGGWAKMYQ